MRNHPRNYKALADQLLAALLSERNKNVRLRNELDIAERVIKSMDKGRDMVIGALQKELDCVRREFYVPPYHRRDEPDWIDIDENDDEKEGK
jgi:hypothetical protein